MKSVVRIYDVAPEALTKIDKLAKEKGLSRSQYHLSSASKALEKVVGEYENYDKKFIKAIADEIFNRLKATQFAVKSADRNSKVALLMLNQLLLDGISNRYSIRISPQYLASEKIVDDKISSCKTKKKSKDNKSMFKVRNDCIESDEEEFFTIKEGEF